MKPWSRYNTIFRSRHNGLLLFNALSGVLLELDEYHYTIAEHLRDGKPISQSDGDADFIACLENNRFLARPEDERAKLMQFRLRRSEECFNKSCIGLTICPTLACNFGCLYCFERTQNDPTIMSGETMAALVEFIRKHRDAKSLRVVWYGGEPTLAFDVVEKLTGRFIELYPDYDNADLVTNAYLLDKRKIDRLNDLKITTVQITLDGGEVSHNKRRPLRNGGPTYARILENIDALLESSWKGRCSVRVNVDKTNIHEYVAIHRQFSSRYGSGKLSVYPGYTKTFLSHSYDHNCKLCANDWSSLLLEGYKNEGIVPTGGFFPRSGEPCICVANGRYGYVVGPKGEIYKCWEDVGRKDMIVGSVHEDPFESNPELVARYIIGTDPYDSEECMECAVFPVCGGGCPNKRLRAMQFGEEGIEYCLPVKESLRTDLEAYMETWRARQIVNAVLGADSVPSMAKGYRMTQPEKNKPSNG